MYDLIYSYWFFFGVFGISKGLCFYISDKDYDEEINLLVVDCWGKKWLITGTLGLLTIGSVKEIVAIGPAEVFETN